MKKELNPVALKELRKLKGFSHQTLADRAGMAKSRLIELEKQPKEPSAQMHFVQVRIYDALKRELGATDTQLRGEEMTTELFPRTMVVLSSKITTIAQMNYDLVSMQYDISSDQLVQLAPLMFAILVEDSFVWRKEQLELRKQIKELQKRTRESQYDPEPDLYDGDIEESFREEEAAIDVRDVFTTPILAELPRENASLSGYASDRFTDFIAAKVQSSGGRIRAHLSLDYLKGRDIRDPDANYVAAPDWFETLTIPGDEQLTAMLRLSLMSGAMRLKDLSAGLTPEQLEGWLTSEVFPAAKELEDLLAPEVYRFNSETEGLGLDEMGFPIRVRRHGLGKAEPQSDERGSGLASA